MAAVDFDETIFNKENVKQVKAPPVQEENFTDHVSHTKKVDWVSDPAIDSMQDRIKNLEGLLKEHLNYQKWKDVEITSPNKAKVISQLIEKGFEAGFVREVLTQMPNFDYFELAWKEAQSILVNKLKVRSDPIIECPGIYALVGTTGVGKTTTVAKLAARYALRFHQDEIGLITTDIYRIAAKEQLSVYANILNIPVYVGETEKQLQQILHRLKGKKLILIDTAGFSQKDPKFLEQIRFLKGCSSDINFVSVLSASTNPTIQHEIVDKLQSENVCNTLITKMDEASSLGELASILMMKQLVLTYLCNGQRVPEDIKQANAVELVRIACSGKGHIVVEDSIEKLTQAAGIDIGEANVKTAYK